MSFRAAASVLGISQAIAQAVGYRTGI